MTLQDYINLAESATDGPWIHKSYQSGTETVLMREWVGPKSAEYGTGYLAASIVAFNIDWQKEGHIEEEKFNNAAFIAASRTLGPAMAKALIEAEFALEDIKAACDTQTKELSKRGITSGHEVFNINQFWHKADKALAQIQALQENKNEQR